MTCRIDRMPLRFAGEELEEAVLETIRSNDLGACYIRPLVWRGFGSVGVEPPRAPRAGGAAGRRRGRAERAPDALRANDLGACYTRPLLWRGFGSLGVDPLRAPVEVAVAAWEWGKYLGDDSEEGVDVCVSSWQRVPQQSLPAVAKATGNYLNASLVKMEAVLDGYAEGIALDTQGFVSEGSGQNVFLVVNGTLVTPSEASSLLPGITRDTVMTLARELGIPVREERIARGVLY